MANKKLKSYCGKSEKFSTKMKNIHACFKAAEKASEFRENHQQSWHKKYKGKELCKGMDEKTALVVFQDKKIRRIWHNNKWYFSVVDVVGVLTESLDAKDYWYRLKKREKEASGIELSTNCRQLKLPSNDGKYYETDCANTETIFRIIQSIPSSKAEPFKQWLAQIGYERIQEIENPELAQQRMKELYKAKGYPEDWIEKTLGVAVVSNENYLGLVTDKKELNNLKKSKNKVTNHAMSTL